MKTSLRLLTTLALVGSCVVAAYLLASPYLRKSRDAQNDPSKATASHDHWQQALAENIAVDPSGDQQLLMAIARLETRRSVVARVHQHATIAGRDFFGSGTYRQQGKGSGREVKLWLKSQRDGVSSTITQVIKDDNLWIDRKMAGEHDVYIVNLWELRNKANNARRNASTLGVGQANSAPIAPQFGATFGGLPMLLQSLRENFEFTAPRRFHYTDNGNHREVYGMVGRWQTEHLAATLLGLSEKDEKEKDNKSDEPLTSAALRERLQKYLGKRPLPDRLPHHVLVLLDTDSLFPCRIEYRNASDVLSSPELPLSELFQFSSTPLSRLDYYVESFDQPLDSRDFGYSPPLKPERQDITASFLHKMQEMKELKVVLERERRLANSPSDRPR